MFIYKLSLVAFAGILITFTSANNFDKDRQDVSIDQGISSHGAHLNVHQKREIKKRFTKNSDSTDNISDSYEDDESIYETKHKFLKNYDYGDGILESTDTARQKKKETKSSEFTDNIPEFVDDDDDTYRQKAGFLKNLNYEDAISDRARSKNPNYFNILFGGKGGKAGANGKTGASGKTGINGQSL